MARHYLLIEGGKAVASTMSDHIVKPGDDYEGMDDGLYRATVAGRGGKVRCLIGSKCRTVLHEWDRLRKMQGDRVHRARTGSPGIAGYQQRADASSGRLYNLRIETDRLMSWLIGQEKPRTGQSARQVRERLTEAKRNHVALTITDETTGQNVSRQQFLYRHHKVLGNVKTYKTEIAI
ncbi:MAG: hypothetical protein ACYS7Y_04265 [Planctomycetota bacterium]